MQVRNIAIFSAALVAAGIAVAPSVLVPPKPWRAS